MYDLKLHLMARVSFWKSGRCGIPLPCHYIQVYSDPGSTSSNPIYRSNRSILQIIYIL